MDVKETYAAFSRALPGDQDLSTAAFQAGRSQRRMEWAGGKPWLLWLQPRGVFHCSLLVAEVQMMLWLAGCKMAMALLCLQAGSRNVVGSARYLLTVLTQ